jgi:hypothetical protein
VLESFAHVAGALSLLAVCKIGRGGGQRARRLPVRHGDPRGLCNDPGGSSAPDPEPLRDAKPPRWPLQRIVVGVWIALSILLLGYATIEGELALADLDGLDLVRIYSWQPPDDAKR